MWQLAIAFCALFVAIHMLIGSLRFLNAVPRSRWLSFGGGVAVSYVFLHILPELAAHAERMAEHGLDPVMAYLAGLFGMTLFYGLERVIRPVRQRAPSGDAAPPAGVAWLHIGSFSLYNVLVGYLLLNREEPGTASIVLFGTAMAFHFLTNDFGLRQDHRERYDRVWRWILSGGVVAGVALGAFVHISPSLISLLFAFLAGSMILIVLKEELPEERQSRLLPFILGVAAYGALLVFV